MAYLLHLRTGRTRSLNPHSVVGRSPDCAVPLDDSVVSSQHASLTWRGEAWWLRDLGSRNGTFVDGRRLAAGEESRMVEGTRLAFGDDGDPWVLDDATAPIASATRLDDGTVVTATARLLLLPNDDDPVLALVQQPNGRWAKDASEEEVCDGQVVRVQGVRWRLSLPRAIEPTVEAKQADVRLRFRVSRDEEYTELEVESDGQTTRLRPRSFNYLLLTLARNRLADAELPDSSRGWIDQETLARSLGVEHRTINVQLYRARRALGSVREDLATRIVERRMRAAQLRFGIEAVEIEVI